MLTTTATLLGLCDGGAHCSLDRRCRRAELDADALGARPHARARLPLEMMVKRQTSETADFFGFHDRGRLAPGLRADVNVIDYDGMRLHVPEIVYDLPAGGRRLVQRVDGYDATLFAGDADVRERRAHRRAARQARPRGQVAPACLCRLPGLPASRCVERHVDARASPRRR